MSSFPVSAVKEKALTRRMQRMGIEEKDFCESFVRASGPGGQKINKTSSCVVLRHIPTGISVRCQDERLRSLNRFLARRRILDLIERQRNGFVAAQRARIEKIRRQKRRRSRRAKEKMLAAKHHHSLKKQQRIPIGESVIDVY